VPGASQVKRRIPEAHLVFIEPPSYEELEARLRGRGTEDEASIKRRLQTAHGELALKSDYDMCIVNDDVDEAAAQLIAYVNEQAEGNR
jgi:guanylate kinase